MGPIIPWLFDPIEGDHGERLPASRFDLVGAVIIAFAVLFAVSFVAQGDIRKAAIALFAGLVPIPLVEARRLVIFCGLAIAAFRIVFVFGAMAFIRHPVWTAAFLLAAFLCLMRLTR